MVTEVDHTDIYNGKSPLELPLYTATDASRYLDIPATTVRYWTRGRTYPSREGTARRFKPLISTKGNEGLSFFNLIELYVLRALREVHAVKIDSVRKALDYAEKTLHIHRLLLHQELLAGGGDLFLDHYGQLINLSKSGQIALKEILRHYLERIDRDQAKVPVRLYPPIKTESGKPIVIDPTISFGKPTIRGKGIRTREIVNRINAGEAVEEVAYDYDLTPELVKSALLYEKAA
jgi:uncharacterized protein (DUF433 family)